MSEPFLDAWHRDLAERVRAFGDEHLRFGAEEEADPGSRVRELCRRLADAGFLEMAVPAPWGAMDLRAAVVLRENLAYYSSLADVAFAAQMLGSCALAAAGSDAQKRRWLPAVAQGEVLAAFALTEPEAGSDLRSIRTVARREGHVWRLDGWKTLIVNAGIAGVYTVLANSAPDAGSPELSLFLADAHAPGIACKPLSLLASLPIGEVRFEDTPAVLLGGEGEGHGLARAALDWFRPGVGAAACGLARRAFDEAVRFVQSRRQFGRPLADQPGVQAAVAAMHVELEAACLMVHFAAWTRDRGSEPIGVAGGAAKLAATEMAQRVVDQALQLHGGQGLLKGSTVERLYREVRALRLYAGANEIDRLRVGRALLRQRR